MDGATAGVYVSTDHMSFFIEENPNALFTKNTSKKAKRQNAQTNIGKEFKLVHMLETHDMPCCPRWGVAFVLFFFCPQQFLSLKVFLPRVVRGKVFKSHTKMCMQMKEECSPPFCSCLMHLHNLPTPSARAMHSVCKNLPKVAFCHVKCYKGGN